MLLIQQLLKLALCKLAL